jgi:HEAT repeat protein
MMTIVRLGKAKSPLATTELIESMNDPSPNVRIQTMLTVVSSRPNKKLVDAIIAILDRNEAEMNIAAVWALGLIGDPRAIPAIRKLLKSKYPILRGRAAIALARLEDRDSVNTLFERFKTDKTVRFAYADAFGVLKIKEAIVPIIDYMAEVSDDITRQSLAYSIASIVGDENMYILVLRQIRRNLKDAREEVHYHLRKRLPGISEDPATVRELIDKALMASIKEDFLGVAASFRKIISLIPQDRLTEEAWTVINHCLPLYEDQTKRCREFIILVAHALLAGCREESKTSKY